MWFLTSRPDVAAQVFRVDSYSNIVLMESEI